MLRDLCFALSGAVKSVFKRLRERSPIDFSRCPVISNRTNHQLPKNLIQIHADEAEVRRRLNCFVERKREEINETNVKDFIEPQKETAGDTDPEETCARVRSSVYRYKNASSHLKGNVLIFNRYAIRMYYYY